MTVNGLNTPWGYDDLAALATAGPDGIMLAKTEDADMVRAAEVVLVAHAPGPTRRLAT